MFKERYENAKKFVKEHKTEIIVGTVCVGATVVVSVLVGKEIKSRNKINTMKEEIKSIANLDISKLENIKKVAKGMDRTHALIDQWRNACAPATGVAITFDNITKPNKYKININEWAGEAWEP